MSALRKFTYTPRIVKKKTWELLFRSEMHAWDDIWDHTMLYWFSHLSHNLVQNKKDHPTTLLSMSSLQSYCEDCWREKIVWVCFFLHKVDNLFHILPQKLSQEATREKIVRASLLRDWGDPLNCWIELFHICLLRNLQRGKKWVWGSS